MIFLITVVIQMGTRYLGISATWTDEVSMYAFIWAVFMGASAMVYEKRHFAFTSLYDAMKNEKAKNVLSIVIDIIMLVFAVLMSYYGVLVTKQFWNYTWTSLPQFKRGPVWLAVPICGVTAALYLIGQIVEESGKLGKGGK